MRSFARGVEAKENTDNRAEEKRDHNGFCGDQSRPTELGRNNARRQDSQANSDQAAHDTERDCFNQELQKDVPTARAHRHADANFARPFRHAHEHDVHDADATHDERHTRDRRRYDGAGAKPV